MSTTPRSGAHSRGAVLEGASTAISTSPGPALVFSGTPWESPFYINRSAVEGPTAFVLDGVHGNESGGWMLDRAALVVLPSVNVLAIHAGRRTFPELGDLNRFYPGEPPESISVFPMQRIAGAILNLFEQFEASMLLDLHES